MKETIYIRKEVDAVYLQVEMAVRHGDEDIPYDFPLREGDMWRGEINIDECRVVNWPQGKSGRLSMKVCDEGTYRLLDSDRNLITELVNEYVPNEILPGEYGDYVDLQIDETGKIENWPHNANLSDFSEE